GVGDRVHYQRRRPERGVDQRSRNLGRRLHLSWREGKGQAQTISDRQCFIRRSRARSLFCRSRARSGNSRGGGNLSAIAVSQRVKRARNSNCKRVLAPLASSISRALSRPSAAVFGMTRVARAIV